MQESGLGKASSNVMQVNGYNGKSANESINAGTKLLSSLLKKTGGDIKLALAAYNMGAGILDFFKKNGGYSVANMQKFSNMQKQKHGYKIYGDPYYVEHVLRYYK
jgi:soluble lytic murein transglycosylase-like protein